MCPVKLPYVVQAGKVWAHCNIWIMNYSSLNLSGYSAFMRFMGLNKSWSCPLIMSFHNIIPHNIWWTYKTVKVLLLGWRAKRPKSPDRNNGTKKLWVKWQDRSVETKISGFFVVCFCIWWKRLLKSLSEKILFHNGH